MLNPGPGVLKDAIKVRQTISNELVVTFHIVDDIEEPANCRLGFFLILKKFKLKINLRLAHRKDASAVRRWPLGNL
jgi:hypothetical protein